MRIFGSHDYLRDQSGEGEGGGAAATPVTMEQLTTLLDGHRTSLLADVDKKFNGALKTYKGDVTKMLTPLQEAISKFGTGQHGSGEGSGEGEGEGSGEEGKKKAAGSPADNAALTRLQRENSEVKKQLETITKGLEKAESEKKELARKGAINEAASAIKFADGRASVFVKAYGQDVRWDDEGNLVADGPNGPMPVKEYFESLVAADKSWLAPKEIPGGSGARPGQGSKNGHDVSEIARKIVSGEMSTNDIAKLKPEEQAAAWSAMQRV